MYIDIYIYIYNIHIYIYIYYIYTTYTYIQLKFLVTLPILRFLVLISLIHMPFAAGTQQAIESILAGAKTPSTSLVEGIESLLIAFSKQWNYYKMKLEEATLYSIYMCEYV